MHHLLQTCTNSKRFLTLIIIIIVNRKIVKVKNFHKAKLHTVTFVISIQIDREYIQYNNALK